jgi:[glutamine synthetase] adenylyltransferase / [glutamine synthetase]-adenylyl-L-tyrosine phosphorylase
MNRIVSVARETFAPELVQCALESLSESSAVATEGLNACSNSFLSGLGKLLVVSPPMLDTLRAHPKYIRWLSAQVMQFDDVPKDQFGFQERWISWNDRDETSTDIFENLRAFKRREYLLLSFLDVAGLLSFAETVSRISALADWVINIALRFCWENLVEEESARWRAALPDSGFAVIAMGKLGGEELNYSSDVDLIFCRRNPDSSKELDLFSKLGERLIRVLSSVGPEGFLYRVDMRLRPYGAAGPLVPTVDNLINYYESWGEAWERQALIKARYIAGCEEVGKRFQDFVSAFTFSRQMDEFALEDVKRVKHRAEKEYAIEPKIHLKRGPGGIRDIEFYVQFSQLTIGWRYPEVRIKNTLKAIEALAGDKVLLDGEESVLSIAYIFLRTVEHRLQLRALTPQSVIPDSQEEVELLARSLGFEPDVVLASEAFLRILNRYRCQVRGILERVYLAPGYLKLNEREEELAQLLSDRTPKQRVRELLSQYGFRDIDKAWQNIRLLALGPAGLLLPPGERRAFVEFAFPMLEVLRDSIDPDQALHNLEDFAAATGNRISFLRALASRRPHLSRLTNLLALSNRCRQILSRHPEYFDSLARGIYLHEGRQEDEMYYELQDRMGASPRGETREYVLRKYRQREMVRIAYRDLAGLADSLEVSRELSGLASACIRAAVDWTYPPYTDPSQVRKEHLRLVVLGKLGSRQMHYASDLDLIFLYDAESDTKSPEPRARFQKKQDERVERIIELLAAVTAEGVAYSVDLRLRPGGASGILARSWESFLEYSMQYMQPWERMALVRSRMIGDSDEHLHRWDTLLASVVYEYDWNEDAFESIRHIKRRIESEKSRESRNHLDFKYGKGGIADLEFLVQFLQIRHGRQNSGIRAPGLQDAVLALHKAGVLKEQEKDAILRAHRFERMVENRYQLMEEWTSREISRESPMLVRLAASLGYRGDAAEVHKAFVSDWDDIAGSVRRLVEEHFF